MSYKKVKLSEICTIEKGATGITKAIEGQYPMVTMAEARISHNEYQFDTKAVLIPLVSSSGHGHASMKRLHYQEGKFALGSILCALVPKNEEEVNARFLYNYLHFQRESILVPLMRGAANVSLSIKSISLVEINLPPIETQISINKLVDDFKIRQDVFQTELKTQSNLLSKLRQAYLQEAVMGKLTEPSQDDAKTLLADIKSQKAQLIKEGKLRKEKPLPPIKPEELPFEIPNNWVWCRLGDLATLITDGTHQTPSYVEKGRIFLSAQNVKPFRFMPEVHRFVSEKDYQEYVKVKKCEKGDILIARVGAGIGESAVIDQELDFAFYVSLGLVKIIQNFIFPDFIVTYINSPNGVSYSKGNIASKGTSAGNFNLERIRNFPIPLPPLSEQKAIVEKVEGLLANVSLLEEENKIQQNEVQRLMGAVLQEAFGGR